MNFSGDHITLTKENPHSAGALTDWGRSDDICLKSNPVIIDVDNEMLLSEYRW